MKRSIHIIIGIFLIAIIASCKKDYYETNFYVQNKCSVAIEVRMSAMIKYGHNYEEAFQRDIIDSNEIKLVREVEAVDDIKMKDVFTEFEIYKGSLKVKTDVMEINNWTKKIISENQIEYTYTVDNTNF